MKDITSILIGIIGIIIFIALLPTLLWIIAILVVVVLIYVAIQKAKYRKYVDDFTKQQKQYEDTTTFTSKDGNMDNDVIDVEYSESEEE